MTLQQQWHRDGYLVMPGLLDPAVVSGLHEACEYAFAQWCRDSSPESEPNGYCYNPAAWIMIHLNHPKYYTHSPAYLARVLNAVATPHAIDAITQIMGEPPVFMQCNYYINPPKVPTFGGGSWHRDCQFFAGGDEKTEKRLFTDEAEPPRELHMHIPLVPTRATGIVPGSHRQWDTPKQLHVRRHDSCGPMPGGIRLAMQPGDVGLFHVNSIHRGYYEVEMPRRTIAVTFGSRSRYRPFDEQWWKRTHGYVASFQPWFRKPGYLSGAEPHTMRLFQRFIETYGHQWREENLHPEVIGPKRLELFTLY